MGNSEKLCDAYVVYVRADCRPCIYKSPNNAKWAVSRKCCVVWKKRKVQVTQKEPWHHAMPRTLQRSSRRQWVLTEVTSGWHTNKLGNAAVIITPEEHTYWFLERKHHRSRHDWQGLQEKATLEGHLPVIPDSLHLATPSNMPRKARTVHIAKLISLLRQVPRKCRPVWGTNSNAQNLPWNGLPFDHA